MDYKSNLLLVIPINFHNVCTIYAPSIQEILNYDEYLFDSLLVPYSVSKDSLKDEYKQYSVFETLFFDKNLFDLFLNSIKIFCKANSISIDFENFELFIDESPYSLNQTNFEEFSEIILLMCCREKYKKKEKEIEPIFSTEEGRERWLKLQEMRKKHNEKNRDSQDLKNIINVVQLGNKTYISEELIKTWSLWKLMNTYISILQIDSYKSNFSIFLKTGSKELVEKHWSDMIKM